MQQTLHAARHRCAIGGTAPTWHGRPARDPPWARCPCHVYTLARREGGGGRWDSYRTGDGCREGDGGCRACQERPWGRAALDRPRRGQGSPPISRPAVSGGQDAGFNVRLCVLCALCGSTLSPAFRGISEALRLRRCSPSLFCRIMLPWQWWADKATVYPGFFRRSAGACDISLLREHVIDK